MDNVSELAGADKVLAVLKAYKSYQAAVGNDSLSKAESSAKLPDAQVFFNESTSAVIIILPERHSSEDNEVQGGALGVAKQVMAIPKVKIAVEEPITYNGSLLSNVGWGTPVMKKPQSQRLFDFEPTAQGSISHQIYERQVGGMVVSTSRYPAENMPSDTPRYNNSKINTTMAAKLMADTSKFGEISVFPVGPDHLLARYDPATLKVHLENAGWKMLANQ